MTWRDGDHFEVDENDLVSHIIGSSAQGGNWKQYWMAHTGRKWPQVCRIQGCGNPADVGVLMWIKKTKNIISQGFIIPIY